MEIGKGSVVLSLKGRDAGKYFLVTSRDGNFVTIADGRERKLCAPKTKRIKHIQPLIQNGCAVRLNRELTELLDDGKLSDLRLRKELFNFQK